MATNPVTIEAIEARWRSLTADETTLATALAADMWARARALVSGLEASMDSGAVPVDVATAVLTNAVVRVLRNPDGLRVQSIDDYSYTRDRSTSSGELYLSDDELVLLGKPRRRAVSMQTTTRSGGPTWA